MTVGNGQKIKCKLKGLVNMNMKGEETVKLTKVLYAPQTVNNILSLSRLVSKGSLMGDTQGKMIIKKNGVNTILDARNGKDTSMMFYLKAKIHTPERSNPQEENTNFQEDKKDINDKKVKWRKKLDLASEMDINVVHRYSHLG